MTSEYFITNFKKEMFHSLSVAKSFESVISQIILPLIILLMFQNGHLHVRFLCKMSQHPPPAVLMQPEIQQKPTATLRCSAEPPNQV